MDVAFHYADSSIESNFGSYKDLQMEFLTYVLQAVPAHRRHIRIRAGSMRLPQGLSAEQRKAVATLIVASPGVWTTISRPGSLVRALISNDIVAFVTEGISALAASEVDKKMESSAGYLGATQVDATEEVHQVAYADQLPLEFRLHDKSLFLLHGAEMLPEYAGEDNRDYSRLEEFRDEFDGKLLEEVAFQDTGLQETVFDPYNDVSHSKVRGRTGALLDSYYDAIIGEISIRFRETDPRLIDSLYAAITALDSHHLAEQLSQAAVSCRRFLERLADALYPPRTTSAGGRPLGPSNYKNRLWAYVEENTKSDPRVPVLLTTLEDVGSRIDGLVKAANSGLHGETNVREVHRLVLGLVMLSYDLLTLTSPTGRASASYDQVVSDSMFKVLKDAAD